MYNYLILVALMTWSATTAMAATLSSAALDITYNERGGAERLISRPDGLPIAVRSDLPVFTLAVRNAAGTEAVIPLSDIRLDGLDHVIAQSPDGVRQVVFKVSRGPRHCALRIAALAGADLRQSTVGVSLFNIAGKRRLRAIPLDWMGEEWSGGDSIQFRWGKLDHPVAPGNLGGFALYTAVDDADEDEALLRIWVDERLPHPLVKEEWSVDRARAWLREWQQRFADRSQLILEGKNIAELRAALPFAEHMQAKEIYLFTQTWRTDNFWPGENGHVHVNRAVFPRGEDDLRDFSDEVAAKGMVLKIHYVSGGIGRNDKLRIGTRPDRRLASWVKGTVVEAMDSDERTITFRPSGPVAMLTGTDSTLGRPRNLPVHFAYNMVRIDDELIEVGAFERGQGDAWRLTDCIRGASGTVKAPHASGSEGAGLVIAYGQVFVPDNDSTLLEEMAKEFAGLVERCRIANTEYDGSEIHDYDGDWGYQKFATLVYQNISHPVAAHDSKGGAPRSNFEYRFNSTRKLLRGSCSFTHGGWNAPVQLDSPTREATRMLDANFFLSQGHYGGAQGLCRPEPMFSVSATSLAQFGLSARMADAILDWKSVSRLMSDEQHARLQATFTPPAQGGMPGRSSHAVSSLVQVVRKTGDGYALVPMRVLVRAAGDIPWQLGQEHGPLGPRQFFKVGEHVALNNPEQAQVPSFIIRVLWAFAPDGDQGNSAAKVAPASGKHAANDAFTAGNELHSGPSAGTVDNLSLMPSTQVAVRNQGASAVTQEGDRLRLQSDNKNEKELWQTNTLPAWRGTFNLSGRRALGMEIDGDGSGATLLVQIRGNGIRDYAVPIDFIGRRLIEIPHGEVAWSQASWGWRADTNYCDYASMGEVALGFGFVPPRTKAVVTVGRLKALAEIPVTLSDPLLTVGSQQMAMKGTVASGEYLVYEGGAVVTVYDANWNHIHDLSFTGPDIKVPTGPVTVTFTATTGGPKPWVELQLTTSGEPVIIKGR